MTRGTTPTITLYINNRNIDFNDVDLFQIAITQGNVEVVHDTNDESGIVIDPDKKSLSLRLTQEETFMFKEGEADIQVRIKYKDGDVAATICKRTMISRSLDNEVL